MIGVLITGMSVIGLLCAISAVMLHQANRPRPDLTARLQAAMVDTTMEWVDGHLIPRAPAEPVDPVVTGWLGENRNTGSTPTFGGYTGA